MVADCLSFASQGAIVAAFVCFAYTRERSAAPKVLHVEIVTEIDGRQNSKFSPTTTTGFVDSLYQLKKVETYYQWT